jgi:hypothetical protein
MKRAIALLVIMAGSATAQDSSFSRLAIRGSIVRFPEIGHIHDHWRAGTGGSLELASNVGAGELALAVGRVSFEPRTSVPPFTGTLFSLGWHRSLFFSPRAEFAAGARLSDLRMDFDDPTMVAGLRTEEEVMLAIAGRLRTSVGHGFSLFAEGSYGMLMLSTRTPIASVSLGVEHGLPMPGWLAGILR